MDIEALRKVEEVYLETGAVKETADRCGISEVKARRILITLGRWSSPASERVRELFMQGCSTDQIAEKLNLTVKAVEAYLPYRKGLYGADGKSADAIRGELYRSRKNNAAENMRKMEESMMDSSRSWEEIRKQRIEEEKKRFTEEDYKSLIFNENDEVDIQLDREGVSFSMESNAVYRLRFELEDTDDISASEKKLAKVEHSISRDVLVPGTMSLHRMHYMIQRLFGWQNSHLHHFSLNQDDFDLVTAGRFGPYADLCGTLFRFPDEDTTDQYWDDDYDESISFRNWLKRKYAHFTLNRSIGDTWVGGQMKLKEFREMNPQITDDMFLVDVQEEIQSMIGMDNLSERVCIKELFAPKSKRQSVRVWKGEFVSCLQDVKEKWKGVDQKEMTEAMEQLGKWRSSYSDWKQAVWTHPDETKKLVQKRYHMSMEKLLQEHKEAIESWLYALLPVFEDCNPAILPCFERINYAYDYGDNWHVRISLIEVYRAQIGEEYGSLGAAFDAHPTSVHITAKDVGLEESDLTDTSDIDEGPWLLLSAFGRKEAVERYRYFDSDDQEVDEALRQQLAIVHVKDTPICVSADGLNVLDDCGGVGGFIDMLKTIYGKDKEESANMRAWANGLGWTGRKTKPENMV